MPAPVKPVLATLYAYLTDERLGLTHRQGNQHPATQAYSYIDTLLLNARASESKMCDYKRNSSFARILFITDLLALVDNTWCPPCDINSMIARYKRALYNICMVVYDYTTLGYNDIKDAINDVNNLPLNEVSLLTQLSLAKQIASQRAQHHLPTTIGLSVGFATTYVSDELKEARWRNIKEHCYFLVNTGPAKASDSSKVLFKIENLPSLNDMLTKLARELIIAINTNRLLYS
tara:strand:+ start:75105 stop:75803 length:699 start_codon:yes stop_codon:yes gene_type:complete